MGSELCNNNVLNSIFSEWFSFRFIRIYNSIRLVGFLGDEGNRELYYLIWGWVCFCFRDIYAQKPDGCSFMASGKKLKWLEYIFNSGGGWGREGNNWVEFTHECILTLIACDKREDTLWGLGFLPSVPLRIEPTSFLTFLTLFV